MQWHREHIPLSLIALRKSVVVDETIFGEANLARAPLRYHDTKTVAVVFFLLCQKLSSSCTGKLV